MKTVLYASLSLNGQVLLAKNPDHQVPQAILADFMQHAIKTGNVIIGRKTADLMLQNPMAAQAFSGVEIIVLSTKLKSLAKYAIASSPRVALDHLSKKGFSDALVAGGPEIYSAFLMENLINEMLININPKVTGNGEQFLSPNGTTMNVNLTELNKLTENVVQLRYKVS
jgi:dihydrofolate reductase